MTTSSGSTGGPRADAPYGFEQAQGGPPDTKAEDMMMDLIERAKGLSALTERISRGWALRLIA